MTIYLLFAIRYLLSAYQLSAIRHLLSSICYRLFTTWTRVSQMRFSEIGAF
jgi:hypothetical protein